MDDEELASTLCGIFLKDVPGRIKTLKDSLSEQDAKGIEQSAHSIRGATANMSGEALSELAKSIEEAACSNDLNFVADDIVKLDTEFEAWKKEMETLIGHCKTR